MREARKERKTKETQIRLELLVDGRGDCKIISSCGFINHMLELMAYHARFDLTVEGRGDEVDDHHLVEDLGILLGEAFKEALGDKKGIRRYGQSLLPMDESLVLCGVDVSGRAYLGFDVAMPQGKVGSFDTELVEEFFLAFVRNSGITLHFKLLSGRNTHHVIEAVFKAFGRALRDATSEDPSFKDEIPSTKGVLK